jgi:hypothetical protein
MSPTVLRRVQLGLISLGVVITIMMAIMVAGTYRNDVLINEDEATAVAEVVSATPTKATVNFSTPDGMFHSPRLGVFYPGRLAEGQRISIEYSRASPELVRVAGRNASLAIVPALSVLVYSYLVIGALMVLFAEVSRRRRSGADLGQGGRRSGAELDEGRSSEVSPEVTATKTS